MDGRVVGLDVATLLALAGAQGLDLPTLTAFLPSVELGLLQAAQHEEGGDGDG